jgi:PAS domain S-box-containing protein
MAIGDRGPPDDDPAAEVARLRAQLADSEARRAADRDALIIEAETLESHREALEQLVGAYADLYDFMPIAYVSLDAGGLVHDVNLTATTLLGVERVRMLGRPLRLHVVPDDRRLFLDHLLRCRRGGGQVTTELRLRAGDGREVPVQVVSRRAGVDDAGLTFRTVLIDLSERRAAEDVLRRSHKQLALALQVSGAGPWEASWPGGELTVSERWARILGYDPGLLPPGPGLAAWLVGRVDPDDLPAREASLFALTTGQADGHAAEFRVRHAGGCEVWVRELAEVADRDPEGYVVRLVGVLVDITGEKQRLAEARAQAGMLRTLSEALFRVEENERRELATALHDDLGQRLVTARMRLAAADPGATAATLELLDQMRETVRSLSFQVSPPILRDLGLVAGLRWLAREFLAVHDLAVAVEAEDLPALPDEHTYLLFRCVRELLLNVVKHARADLVSVAVAVEGGRLRISVEDDGVGFDPDALAASRSFGLLSVRERLGWLGGQVVVDSAPGAGTRVGLVVPLGSAGLAVGRGGGDGGGGV